MSSPQDDLLRAFRISIEDLEANRRGQLGATQRRKLLNGGNWNVVLAFVLILVLAAILYGVAAKPLAPIQWILCVILSVIILAVGTQYFRQTRAAVAQGRVEQLVGQVHKHSHGNRGWFLTVAGHSFRLPVVPWHIQQDATYRVYYEPQLHVIVAMEPENDGSTH